MSKIRHTRYLRLPRDVEARLIAGARDCDPVKGLTHGYYKYPARFSPAFVRAAIETFTVPGDLCLDNHVGGGTTLVEALALGRSAVGIDISTLAEFVANVKTILFSDAEIARLRRWVKTVERAIDIHKPSACLNAYAELGYYKHLDHPGRWRLRKAIEQAIASAVRLKCSRLEAFGRCAVLRTAQWALDGRKSLPTLAEFRLMLSDVALDMIAGARELRDAAHRSATGKVAVKVINRSATGLERDERIRRLPAPRLVVTSPPYPGVHVLYHRWQVDGRKEAPLPFMIAGKLDGSGSSYYTMGDRKYPELKTYFDNIRNSMGSVAQIADAQTIIVQMVAFAEPEWQLQRYLDTMAEAGLREFFLPSLKAHGDGRLWRSVPGRRWYSDQRGETPGSQEVVLFHRKAPAVSHSTSPNRQGSLSLQTSQFIP